MPQSHLLMLLCFVGSSFAQFNGCTNPVRNDSGICWCDLSSYCDVACCCDEDCADTLMFATCDSDYNLNASCTCIRNDLIFSINTATSAGSTSYIAPNTSCVYQDTQDNLLAMRNYYIEPNCVYRSQPSSQSYAGWYSEMPVSTSYGRYRSGDPVLIVYSANDNIGIGSLSLPKPIYGQQAATGECADNSVASFLRDETSECKREILDIKEACNRLQALNVQSYYVNMSVITDPAVINWTQSTYPVENLNVRNTVPIRVTATSIAGECAALATSENPSPTLNESLAGVSCDCVVREVSYRVGISVSDGVIVSVDVSVLLGNLASSELRQKFSVQYVYSNNPNRIGVFQKSGSPGYLLGMPVWALYDQTVNNLSGCFRYNQSTAICPLRIFGSTKWSNCMECLSNPLECASPVNFGLNYRSGCTFLVDSGTSFNSLCPILQNQTAYLLAALPYPAGANVTGMADYLPKFRVYGTTEADNNDWVPSAFTSESRSASLDSEYYRRTRYVCDNVIRSLTIEVAYTNTGSLASPQPAIVDVVYRLGALERLVYNDDTYDRTRLIELSAAVVFVNISSPSSTPMASAIPVNPPTDRISWSDFFYLFYV